VAGKRPAGSRNSLQHTPSNRRWRPGTHALREIKYYQSAAMAEFLVLPKYSFMRVVKEISDQHSPGYHRFRWQSDALTCLQMATEHILVLYMEMTRKMALHAKRQTIMKKDSELLRDLWNTIDPSSPIGQLSEFSKTSNGLYNSQAQQRTQNARLEAWDKREQLEAMNSAVPSSITHFLRGWKHPRHGRRRENKN